MTPEEELFSIFMPYASKRQFDIQKSKSPLVHYTTAEAGLSIIKNKEFWMRESSCMNDFSEIDHGIKCVLRAYYEGDSGKLLKEALNALYPEINKDIEDEFNKCLKKIRSDTYLACFSEHDEENEGLLGRLSMWRAYSGKTGVAIVMNNDVFFNESEYFSGLYTSPVAYLDDSLFEKELFEVAKNAQSHPAEIKAMGKEDLVYMIVRVLIFAAVCTKHIGFSEEREWRLTYNPSIESTDNLIKDIVNIRGVPQIIYKIPLKNPATEELVGLDLNELIQKIIIGPSDYSLATYKAFYEAMTSAGIENPADKIKISGIPLR